MGVRPGTSPLRILSAITATVAEPIALLATLDQRLTELTPVAHHLGVELVTFTARQLAAVDVPTPSPTVETATGTPSVAEAAALLASRGNLVRRKAIVDGIVIATAAKLNQ
ncbi:cobalamin biosynthesis protein [Nocardia camponoti]|uniref:CobE/GbiG C-terminal domain-containing protein n=1 Tax=Nocardia camponoti TaxID=1616106 RepID=A0A917V652_9NOCA|nr:cobalamin biosynthesis protein [Nocardia camponoti]GGK42269.1 hypothetical protein GCM10011591_12310 [Nocardia camponoti]